MGAAHARRRPCHASLDGLVTASLFSPPTPDLPSFVPLPNQSSQPPFPSCEVVVFHVVPLTRPPSANFAALGSHKRVPQVHLPTTPNPPPHADPFHPTDTTNNRHNGTRGGSSPPVCPSPHRNHVSEGSSGRTCRRVDSLALSSFCVPALARSIANTREASVRSPAHRLVTSIAKVGRRRPRHQTYRQDRHHPLHQPHLRPQGQTPTPEGPVAVPPRVLR